MWDCGLFIVLVDDLIMFYIVFGKIVLDIFLNVVVNLGYVEGWFLYFVYVVDMLILWFEVIGVK